MDSQYLLRINDTLWPHTSLGQWLIHDGAPEKSHQGLQAQIASGDYFITLATQLDEISKNLAKTQPEYHLALEKIISDITFLQEHYAITRI